MFAPRLCPPYASWVKGKVERPIRFIREGFWRGYRFFRFISSRYERASLIIFVTLDTPELLM